MVYFLQILPTQLRSRTGVQSHPSPILLKPPTTATTRPFLIVHVHSSTPLSMHPSVSSLIHARPYPSSKTKHGCLNTRPDSHCPHTDSITHTHNNIIIITTKPFQAQVLAIPQNPGIIAYLTHSLTHSLAHLLTDLFTRLSTHPCNYRFTYPPTKLLRHYRRLVYQEDLFKAISAQYVSMIGSLNKKNRFPVYGEIFFMTFHKDVVFRVRRVGNYVYISVLVGKGSWR